MEYFFYCRDKPEASALHAALTEDHWSFMDDYADVMIARGPTLRRDRTDVTGSMHIVDLPNPAAAQVFAFDEPNFRAGVYSGVMIRRWRNELRRTMWDFDGARPDHLRFLVLGHPRTGLDEDAGSLLDDTGRFHAEQGYADRLIAWGPLLRDDGSGWAGTVTLVELPDRAAVEDMVAAEPYTRAGWYSDVEIHDWEFGGRR